MAKIGTLEIEIKGKIAQFKKQMSQSKKEVSKLKGELGKLKKKTDETSKSSSIFNKTWVKVTAGIAVATLAIRQIIRVLGDLVRAFAAQEQAEARLNQQLKNLGVNVASVSSELRGLAAQRQKVTTFGDEESISALALAASYQLNVDQLKRLLPALQDLSTMTATASGSQADLEQSVKLMGFVLEGQAGMLRRVGVTMSDLQTEMIKTGTKGEKFNAFLEAVQDNAGGLAVAIGETATGGLQKFENKLGDIKEKAGKNFLEFLNNLINKFKDLGLAGEVSGIPAREMKLLRAEFFKMERPANEFAALTDEQIVMFHALRQAGLGVSEAFSEMTRRWEFMINPAKVFSDLLAEISDERLVQLKSALQDNLEINDKNIVQLDELFKRTQDLDRALELLTLRRNADKKAAEESKKAHEDSEKAIEDETEAIEDQKKSLKDLTPYEKLQEKLQALRDRGIEFQRVKDDLFLDTTTGELISDEEVQKLKEAKEETENLSKKIKEDMPNAIKSGEDKRKKFIGDIDSITSGLKNAQRALDKLNSTPINDKTATWTINIVKTSSGGGGGGSGDDSGDTGPDPDLDEDQE